MNALEASGILDELTSQVNSLARVCYYLSDDRDFDNEIDTLSDLQRELEKKRDDIADKMRSVQL